MMASETWWREASLDEGRTAEWRIGPLRLAVHRARQEWRLAHEWADESGGPMDDWSVSFDAEMPEAPEHLERYVFRRPQERIEVLPVLADRTVVTSPRIMLYLLPGEEATLFVGSPLWVRVQVGRPARMLTELAVRRPSDTWVGTTTEGELCYSTRTRAALDAANLPLLARSAVTPVRIQNRASTALPVERLNIPVPYLSLYSSESGVLWTQRVTLVRDEDGDMAQLKIQDGPPPAAPGASLVAGPRTTAGQARLIRAFSSLWNQMRNESDD